MKHLRDNVLQRLRRNRQRSGRGQGGIARQERCADAPNRVSGITCTGHHRTVAASLGALFGGRVGSEGN